MPYHVQVKIATISLWNFAALILHVVAFAILYFKANKNKTMYAFFIVQFSMFLWLLGKVLKTVSPTTDMRWMFILVYYFGICLLEVSFFDFAYLYNKGKRLKKDLRILIYTIGLLQFLLVLTNPIHFLFYSKYSFWGDDFGPLFYLHVLINYSFIVSGMVLCSKKFQSQVVFDSHIKKYLITSAILVPIILNFIYISGYLHKLFSYLEIQIFDITPLVFTISLLVFVYATFKYEFFGLTPIMKHEISQHVATPVVVMLDDELVYKNKLFEDLQLDMTKVLELKNKSILKIMNTYYRINCSVIKHPFRHQTLISLSDISDQYVTKSDLDQKNEELKLKNEQLERQIEMIRERSRISAYNLVSRELHDIVGHSLVVSMRLLEASRIEKNDDKKLAFLGSAKEVIINGHDEILTLLKGSPIENTLYDALLNLKNTLYYTGVDISLFMNQDIYLDKKTSDHIHKIMMELTANTIKHTQADKIMISVLEKDGIHIQYMDNGGTSLPIKEGNGFRHIRERLASFDAQFNYEISNDGMIVSIKYDQGH